MSNDARSINDDMNENEIDPIEGYCMSCREKVELDDAQAVWTSQGRPGTRGTCPICGGNVYRMGHTDAHDDMKRPEAIQVVDNSGIRNTKAAKIKVEAATYIVGAESEAALIEQIGDDLEKLGISTWRDYEGEEDESVQWAGGVHPALTQCKKMIVVLSESSLSSERVEKVWQYFHAERKPIVVALAEDVSPPDDIRRSPRFDIYSNYKKGFRQMMSQLARF